MNSKIVIRSYTSEDRDECIKLFESNSPKYFDPKDKSDFENYLDNHPETALAIEDPEQGLLACGGYWITQEGIGRLSYGMVENSYHGKGLGRVLFLTRIMELTSLCDRIEIDTTQRAEGFYEKFGFTVKRREPGAHGEGLDRVVMELDLSSIQRLDLDGQCKKALSFLG